MRPDYSFKKGFYKALSGALYTGIALASFAGVSELTVVDILRYAGGDALLTMTVGGALRMSWNFVKFNLLEV